MKRVFAARTQPSGSWQRVTGSIVLAVLLAGLAMPVGAATSARSNPVDGHRSSDGNAVTDWSSIASDSIVGVANKFPGHAAVWMAVVQAAIYDAVIAIKDGFEPYATDIDAPRNSSPKAATAAAGHDVLVGLFPDQKESLDETYQAYLAGIPDGNAKENGIAVGQKAAAGILALRADDGRDDDVPWEQPPPGPGVYEPRGQPPPQGVNMPFITPFMLRAASQFRPRGPDRLRSKAYTRDFNEVKKLGRIDSSRRNEKQTEIALFWSEHPLAFWVRNLNSLAMAQGLGIADTARMLAMTELAGADAMIACWDAKYHYLFWRPVHAIQRADTDGNPHTRGDPSWTPLLVTPNHPEYPSGHSCMSTAITRALAEFFGTEKVRFSMDSLVTNTTHVFKRFKDVVPEVQNARIWAGIHFRRATEDGVTIGRRVTRWMVERFFLPEDR